MGRLLLVGNSRWHWAEREAGALRVWHQAPPERLESTSWRDLEAWACVGALPPGDAPPAARRIGLEQVPLRRMPPWLGVDRALVGWQAWRRQGGGVLVADAGTCLSLTGVDGQGQFLGGRLSAGLALQLRSLGSATAALPERLDARAVGADDAAWPTQTAAAMRQGCLRACAAAVARGWRERPDGAGALWLTGGDGALLEPLLRQEGLEPRLAPDLGLEALAALALS